MSNIVKSLPLNEYGRDFIIGDLHGCYNLLMKTLKSFNFDFQKDRVISCGDLIDRGEDSLKCLELVFEPWFYAVRGNHEEMMFNGILENSENEFSCWLMNGGNWFYQEMTTVTEVESFKVLLEDIKDRMPLAYEIQTKDGVVGVLHADSPELWCEQTIRDQRMRVLWGRSRAEQGREVMVSGIDRVFSGHTPLDQAPIEYGNITYMDTGAVWSGRLGIVEI